MMGLRSSTALRNARANAVKTLLDAGSGAGKLLVYTGAQPTNPNTSVGAATLLATFTLADPSFADAVNGVLSIDADPVLTTTGVAAGTAGFFRATDSADNAVIDGTVTATGGGGNLELNTLTISIGLELRITGGGWTEPVGV